MTENTDEEHVEKLDKQSSENIPDDMTSTKGSVTIFQNQESENMEVHHHPHLSHEKKNWKSYFWEFLMLFLAVFCGFLAEYQLEHVIEHQREREYMQSFIRDLERDTANLNASFPLKEQRVQAIDSIFDFFEKNNTATEVPAIIHDHMRRALWDRHQVRNDGTIDQLKNAGGLRLIRKRNVADSVAAYDMQWSRLEYWRETYIENQRRGSEMLEKMLDPDKLLDIYKTDESGQINNLFRNAPSVKLNTAYLKEYLNFLYRQKFITIQDERNYKAVEKSAERLSQLIKKEYHLE